jgi:hypothetical protein
MSTVALPWACSSCEADGVVERPLVPTSHGICNLHEELTRLEYGLVPWRRFRRGDEGRTACSVPSEPPTLGAPAEVM